MGRGRGRGVQSLCFPPFNVLTPLCLSPKFVLGRFPPPLPVFGQSAAAKPRVLKLQLSKVIWCFRVQGSCLRLRRGKTTTSCKNRPDEQGSEDSGCQIHWLSLDWNLPDACLCCRGISQVKLLISKTFESVSVSVSVIQPIRN